jgi:hypothetical protein
MDFERIMKRDISKLSSDFSIYKVQKFYALESQVFSNIIGRDFKRITSDKNHHLKV